MGEPGLESRQFSEGMCHLGPCKQFEKGLSFGCVCRGWGSFLAGSFNSCVHITIFSFGHVIAPQHYLVIVMSNSDPAERENSLFLNVLHIFHYTFSKIEGVVNICFPLQWFQTPRGPGEVRGTRVVQNCQRLPVEIMGYLGIEEQLKEPEVIKSMLVSFDNSRWTDQLTYFTLIIYVTYGSKGY